MIVPWFGHVLSMLAVALIGWTTALRGSSARTALSPGFWLPLLAMAADPLLGFTASRLWIDSLLTGLTAMAFAALVMALSGGRRAPWLLAAGGFLGLAALTKLTALLVLPVFLAALLFCDRPTWRRRCTSILWFGLPVLLLVAPWLVLFKLRCGVFLPNWVAPDLWLREHSPFVKAALDRPFYYYAVKLPLLLPIALVAAWALRRWRDWRTKPTMMIAVGWCVAIVVALTALSATGYGFQMRHVAPAVVPLYVVVMVGLLDGEHPVGLLMCGCALSVGTFTAGLHVLAQVDEVFSLAEISRLIGF